MDLLLSGDDSAFINGKYVPNHELSDQIETFIKKSFYVDSTYHLTSLPHSNKSVHLTSNHSIVFRNTNDIDPMYYIKTQNNLGEIYTKLRNQIAQNNFGISFEEMLTDPLKFKSEIIFVRHMLPQRVQDIEP